jgi:hypothetical protein
MLPEGFDLRHLDSGILEAVVNLNRIPGVFTNTTCEGHIWRNTPAWPTKDGWIHFNVKKETNKNLISKIKKNFIEKHPIFELEEWNDYIFDNNYLHYTMVGHYESHDDGNLFGRIGKFGQWRYFRRAEKTRKEMLKGWLDFNETIISYLRENFGKEYEKLPYI